MQVKLTLYTRRDCHLCDEMKAVVLEVAAGMPVLLEAIDIDTVPLLARQYGRDIPVLLVDGEEIARHRVTADALRKALETRRTGRQPA